MGGFCPCCVHARVCTCGSGRGTGECVNRGEGVENRKLTVNPKSWSTGKI